MKRHELRQRRCTSRAFESTVSPTATSRVQSLIATHSRSTSAPHGAPSPFFGCFFFCFRFLPFFGDGAAAGDTA